jgi:hypothetical protein
MEIRLREWMDYGKRRSTDYEERAFRAEKYYAGNKPEFMDKVLDNRDTSRQMRTNKKAGHEEALNHAIASLKSQSTDDKFGSDEAATIPETESFEPTSTED